MTSRRLADVLTGEPWLRRSWPFPHLVANNVFEPRFYRELEAHLGAVLASGLSDSPRSDRFSRSLGGYDAYGIGFPIDIAPPLDLFVSEPWRDLMCGLFDVGATQYVYAGAHHHGAESKDGFVHNDFNPAWFPRANDGELVAPEPQRCDYKTGGGTLTVDDKVCVVRAVVVLFFLLNEGWYEGLGGETGLYLARDERPGRPALCVPPCNNTLVMFECTPQSFHGFIASRGFPRTSIIMWIHRELDEADARFGVDNLEAWQG